MKKKQFSKYYAIWILCCPPYPIIPDNPGKKPDPYLLGEFMKVIKVYNEKGESIVFLTESDPLFYQSNLFLRDLQLNDKVGNLAKADLQLEGEYKNDKLLKWDESGELKSNGLFNKSQQTFLKIKRASLPHNL